MKSTVQLRTSLAAREGVSRQTYARRTLSILNHSGSPQGAAIELWAAHRNLLQAQSCSRAELLVNVEKTGSVAGAPVGVETGHVAWKV